MTNKEVLKLHAGDEVWWNDPDEGTCSRYYRIRSIEVHDPESPDPMTIISSDLGDLECFASELG